jgi:mannose-6-phosphate isomerase-like protein (cupin superfamily)
MAATSGSRMAILIDKATIIQAAGNKPKRIEEFVGRLNTRTQEISIALMTSPTGWEEPGQTPEFDEYTFVLSGTLRVETKTGILDVPAGSAVHAVAGEWVRYSTPSGDGARYLAVCLPAFSLATVHRDT